MPLPVSPQQLISRPQMYVPEYPPFLPNVPMHESVAGHVKAIAAALATMVGKKAISNQNNALWIFTFNLSASNNFRNEYFAHAFKIAVDNITYRLMAGRGGLSPQDFEKAIEESVLMAASSFANMFYNDLAAYLYQEQITSIQQNLQHLQLVTDTVAGLIYNRNSALQAPAPAAHQAYSAQSQPQPHSGLATFGMGATGYYDPNAEREREEAQRHRDAVLSRRNSLVQGIRGNANESGSDNVHKEERKKEPTEFNKQQKYPFVTGGLEAMDPKVHAIAYGDQIFSAPGSELQETYLSQVKHLGELTQLAIKGELTEKDKMIGTRLIIASGTEEFLTNVRIDYTKEAAGVEIYTSYGMAGTPIIATFDISDLANRIKEQSNLFGIRKEVISWAKEKEATISPRAIQQVVSQIDRAITNQINDVLLYELCLDTKTSSALADLDELEDYLKSKPEFYLHQQFRKSCRDIGSNIAKGLKELSEVYSEVSLITSDTNLFYFPLFKSIFATFVTATHEELGYNITRTIKRVSKDNSPILQSLMDSVLTISDRKLYRCTENYIVTIDGYMYRISGDTESIDMINVIRVD